MGKGWTPEHRALQAQRIREWRPWARSTGPKTEAGKAAASGNAWKGGTRAALRRITAALRELQDGGG